MIYSVETRVEGLRKDYKLIGDAIPVPLANLLLRVEHVQIVRLGSTPFLVANVQTVLLVHSRRCLVQHLAIAVFLVIHLQWGRHHAIVVSLERILRRYYQSLPATLNLRRPGCSCIIASTLYLDPTLEISRLDRLSTMRLCRTVLLSPTIS
jgi:hypothetical protein